MSQAPVSLRLYELGMKLLTPVAPLVLRARARRGKEDPARLGERLGRPSLPRPEGGLVWLHGASVGESLSHLPLVERLRRERPDLNLLVTAGTVTAAELLARRLPEGAAHQYAPLDTPTAAAAFLAHWRPGLAVFVESELWPNLLAAAKASGARLALLGARLSQSSARNWGRFPEAAQGLFGLFDLVMAQDAPSAERLQGLGARVAGLVDLKQAGSVLPCDEAELRALREVVGKRPVMVAASTHPGEEEVVARAFQAVAKAWPKDGPAPLLIVAPRHPARGEAVARLLADLGLSVGRRSRGETPDAWTQAYVADTLGELGLFFRAAGVVVMGGGLVGGIGGHNPLEPARLGAPVISGLEVANFRQTYAALTDARAVVMIEDETALAAKAHDLLAHPDRARELGLRAKAYAERGDKALDAAWDALQPLLPR